MKASTNNSISKLTTLTLALFVVMMSSSAHAVEPAAQNSQPVPHVTIPSSHDAISTRSSRAPHSLFRTDQGMPLAREDVDPIKTAVVPGRAFVPSTTPSNTRPTYTPITPRYQSAPQSQPMAPRYQSPAGGTIKGKNKPVDPQVKISSRNTDPKMLGFLRNTSMQELIIVQAF